MTEESSFTFPQDYQSTRTSDFNRQFFTPLIHSTMDDVKRRTSEIESTNRLPASIGNTNKILIDLSYNKGKIGKTYLKKLITKK